MAPGAVVRFSIPGTSVWRRTPRKLPQQCATPGPTDLRTRRLSCDGFPPHDLHDRILGEAEIPADLRRSPHS